MKILKYTYLCLILLSFTIILSCKKENVQLTAEIAHIDSCLCVPFPKPDIVGSPSPFIQYSDSFFIHVEINPLNSDEMVYNSGQYPNINLVYFNNQTKEKRVLFAENVIGNISWSVKGWILFMRSSNMKMYKIKSSGDSLKQISNSSYFHGIWNTTGDKIPALNTANNDAATIILDENGVAIDSIGTWWHREGKWNHPHYYLGSSITQIVVMDITNKTFIKKIDFPEQSDIHVLGWVSMDEFWYRNDNKLFSQNLATNTAKLLKCECYQIYETLSTNIDFTNKIATKLIRTYLGNYMTLYESKIISLGNNAEELEEVIPY